MELTCRDGKVPLRDYLRATYYFDSESRFRQVYAGLEAGGEARGKAKKYLTRHKKP